MGPESRKKDDSEDTPNLETDEAEKKVEDDEEGVHGDDDEDNGDGPFVPALKRRLKRRDKRAHIQELTQELLHRDDGEDEDEDEDNADLAEDGDDIEEDAPDEDMLKEPIVVRWTYTKGKFPRKPKRKRRPVVEEEPAQIVKESQLSVDERLKRRRLAEHQRHTLSIQAEPDASCLADDTCGDDDSAPRQPIHLRYYRTKAKGRKPLQELQELEEQLQEGHDEEGGEGEGGEGGDGDVEEGGEARDPGAHENEPDAGHGGAEEEEAAEKAPKKQLKVKPRSADLTGAYDAAIKEKLDKGDKMLEERKLESAAAYFSALMRKHPESPRAAYGHARALDKLSDRLQSNDLLENTINAYTKVVALAGVPEKLYVRALGRLVDRARFRGWPQKALAAQKEAASRLPLDYAVRNEMGVTYLLMGRAEDAKRVFAEVLADDADNGFAAVHYGFVLKTVDEDLPEAVKWMGKGLGSGAEGTDQARFYYHLGDALQRLGKPHQAYRVYDQAARKGYFLSRLQRSVYNCPGLAGRPWWSLRQTGLQEQLEFQELEKQWKTIRDEGLALLNLNGTFQDEVARLPEAALCRRGQVKFSVLEGGTRVRPHCGPTNCRLRAHLGLQTPIEPRIRVANETRHWKLGKFIVFDDSFEHEVWHDGALPRLVLVLDFWHPGLSPEDRAALSPL